MAEHIDDAMKSADEAIAALKRQKPASAAAARARSAELVRLNQILLDASRKVVDANAAKRISNGGSNGAKPAGGKRANGVLNRETLAALAQGLVPWVKECVAETVAPLNARLDALEKRKPGIAPLAAQIAGIEQRMMKYDGVWSEAKSYTRGSFVTHAGSLWFCEDGSIGVRPGAGSSAWKLAVKKGHAER